MKLFCFPFAGSSAYVYKKWQSQLTPTAQIVPMELAGKGLRAAEALYGSFDQMIDDCLSMLLKLGIDQPYAFFGHSMGGYLAYELCHRLNRLGKPLPACLFISGSSSPGKNPLSRVLHSLNDAAFHQAILDIGGIPPEVASFPDFYTRVLTMLKNDFRLIETFWSTTDPTPLDCPMMVFHGRADRTINGDIRSWRGHTTGPFRFHEFDGGHFFINEHGPAITALMADQLRQIQAIPGSNS